MLKVIQKLWALVPKQIWNRSFKWGTKLWFWSRGCKDTRGQSWSLKKNICQLGRPRARGFEPGWSADIFFELQLWLLISSQSIDKNQCLVRHLKALFHICLETKAQDIWMPFKVFNLGSKWPHLHRAYVLRVCNNLGSTVVVCMK